MTTLDPVAEALRTAITVKDGAELRVALARHLLDRGGIREASVEVEAALSIDPGNSGALELKGEIDARTGGGSAPASDEPEPSIETLNGDEGRSTTRTAEPRLAAPRVNGGALRLAAKDGKALEGPEHDAPATLTLDDVGGLDDVKGHIERAFLQPLRRPEVYRRFGKRAGGGLILYGPPGCGKTYIARALAGELGARFVSIGLADVLDMWLGESERKLHELFENARRSAPTLIVFDEVDALGQRRSQLKHSAGRNVVNQLLAELDGMGGGNDDVFVLGATNHPWDVDAALRRPGRFDSMVFVPPPDTPARERILGLHLATRPVRENIALHRVAKRTGGYSGADLRAIVDRATDFAIERTLADGTGDHPIDEAMLLAAAEGAKASTRPWFETARNYAVYANEGGTFDELLSYMRGQRLA